ncbi:MAG: hypothetical protein IKP00_05350 [Victivallales bacterium]|nr:hypothetical protein [Victivallales bacterium]
MHSTAQNIIIAADFGGTKGDLLLVDAESGAILKRVQEDIHSVPASVMGEKAPTRGGGRSVEMGNYCLTKGLEGLSPQVVHIIYTGFNYDESIFTSRGIRCVCPINLSEEDGIMVAEDCKVGVCCILGTGATTMIYKEGEPPFIVDALGPICGDWGGGVYIGYNFVRNILREQMFTAELMWETSEILSYLEEQMIKMGEKPAVERARTPSWDIVRIFLRRHDRSFVASLAKLCDKCARQESAIARENLEKAGEEAAVNIVRGVRYTGVDKLATLPVIVSGSILLRSDIVYESFCNVIKKHIPQAEIRRSYKPQTYGQTIRMLEILHGKEKAASRIMRFKMDAVKMRL